MTWKFNKDNWQYIAEDNIEEFLNGGSKPTKDLQDVKPKTKHSKKFKQVI